MFKRFNPPVTVQDIVEYLECLRSHAPYLTGGDEYVDVRLQCMTDWYDFHWGDPQYDTDHRGVWAYGSLDLTDDACEDQIEIVAQDMYDQLLQVDILEPELH